MIKILKFDFEKFYEINCFYIGTTLDFNKKKIEGSALANPFEPNETTKYKLWLWEKMKNGIKGKKNDTWDELKYISNFAKRYTGEEVLLMYDDALEVSSANVVKAALEWLLKLN